MELKVQSSKKEGFSCLAGRPLTHACSQTCTLGSSFQRGIFNFVPCLQYLDGSLMDPMSKGYDKCSLVDLTNFWSIFYLLLYGSRSLWIVESSSPRFVGPKPMGLSSVLSIHQKFSFVQYHRIPSCLFLKIITLHFRKLLRTQRLIYFGIFWVLEEPCQAKYQTLEICKVMLSSQANLM